MRHTPSEVWALVRSAEVMRLLGPQVVRDLTLPGTGPGVGEQQLIVFQIGSLQVPRLLTVLDEGEGWAETVDDLGIRMRHEVAAAGLGTRLTLTWVVPATLDAEMLGTGVTIPDPCPDHHAFLDAVKDHLDAERPLGV